MRNLGTFQVIILGIFVVALIGAVIIFATTKGNVANDAIGQVSMWGTVNARTFNLFLDTLNATISDDNYKLKISYVERNPATFDTDLVEAIANGRGPDMMLLPQDSIVRNLGKIYFIPYKTYGDRLFRDTFVEGTELYLTPWGVAGLPFSLDPLIMYWNRSHLNNESLPYPPRYWDEFPEFSKKLTKKDDALNILQSIAALGEYRNVENSKDILSAMALERGSPLAYLNQSGILTPALGQGMQEALRFYIAFADPTNPVYSWNRSFASAKQRFLSGNSALYFGFASEVQDLRNKNPNLNFDVAFLPQFKDRPLRTTFGRMQAFSILRNSPRINNALRTMYALTSAVAIQNWSAASGLPPVRRDLLVTRPTDSFNSILYDSAIQAKAWLDPNAPATGSIFFNMVESVTAGRQEILPSIRRANDEIGALVR